MPLLSRPLLLYDVRDVEALCTSIVQRSRLSLDHHDREDLTAYLIATCWELSLRYEPGRTSFSTWATTTLRLRVIDWNRARNGRTRWQFSGHTYERERPRLVPLDAELVDTLPTGTGDPALDSDPDLGGILDAGDRQEARDYLALGLELPTSHWVSSCLDELRDELERRSPG
jgi:DNA-directed RNA polymerase specialized sigma24 family protein